MTDYRRLVAAAYHHAGIPSAQQDPTLPDQIVQAVADLTPQLAGPDRPGEDYLAKLGRLNAAHQQAVEVVLADLLPQPRPEEDKDTAQSWPPTWPTDPDHPLNDDQLVETMTEADIRQHLQDFDRQHQPAATTPTLDELTARARAFADARDWHQFHTPRNLAMALTGEVGELVAELQWLTDAQITQGLRGELRQRLSHEMADVFIYLLRLADVTGIDLVTAANDKIDLNERRYPADRARGNALKYTDLET